MPYLLSMRATVVPGFVIDFGLSYAAKFFSITLPFQNNLQNSNVPLRLDSRDFCDSAKLLMQNTLIFYYSRVFSPEI